MFFQLENKKGDIWPSATTTIVINWLINNSCRLTSSVIKSTQEGAVKGLAAFSMMPKGHSHNTQQLGQQPPAQHQQKKGDECIIQEATGRGTFSSYHQRQDNRVGVSQSWSSGTPVLHVLGASLTQHT